MTYRLAWGYAIYLWVVALMFAAGAIAAAIAPQDGGGPNSWAVAGFAVFASSSALAGVGTRRTRLTIDDTAIEWVEFGKPRRLLVEQISGYRVLRVLAGTYVIFEPRDPGARRLRVPLVGPDNGFTSWLARIPHLDG